jgi:uncharacterized membrane protein
MELAVIVLAIVALVLFRLFTDKDSRWFPREDPEGWRIYSRKNAIFLVVALVSIYVLFRLIKWVWMRS